jgi:Nucleoside 2-deoxyribosyltransferase
MTDLAHRFATDKPLAAAVRPSIYLTGPITGVDLTLSDGWRRRLENELGAVAAIFDPVKEGAVHEPLYRSAGATARLPMREFGEALAERNKAAIQTCDLLYANLKGATGISLGSVGEIFWADAFRKPILIVRDEFNNPHDHLLLNAIATWTFFTLEDSVVHLREFFAVRS